LIKVIENNEELQNVLSPGALKLAILDKKELDIKRKERFYRETNIKLKEKIDYYNKNINQLQKLLEEVKTFLTNADIDNGEKIKNKIDQL